MEKTQTFVTIATSSPLAFVSCILILIVSAFLIYFTYRALRDLEVFLLERQRLKEEILEREEDNVQWDSSSD